MTPKNPLQDLITELCPQRVEWKSLGELGKFYGGLSGKTKNDFEGGNAKYISYMNIFNNLAVDLESNDFVKIGENERQHTIQYGDVLFTGSSETHEECGMSSVVTQHPIKSIYLNSFCFGFRFENQNLISPEFAKFLFREHTIRKQIIDSASGVTRYNISKKKMEKVKIPIPPLEIQNRIVEILDTFTELERELEKELSARKKQYEHYRNTLLSFESLQQRTEKLTGGGARVKMCSLSELFSIRNGYTPSKANKAYWENGTIPWFRMEDIRKNGRILSDSIQHITPEAVKGKGLIPANSMIIATTATIGEHALIIVDSLMNQRFTCLAPQVNCCVLNMKYFYYYGFILGEWCKNNTNVSGFASVDMTKFKSLQIPIPPIEVQNEVVEILDRFDAMVSSITEGLPAEIHARKKQYEYYRDRLLSFEAL